MTAHLNVQIHHWGYRAIGMLFKIPLTKIAVWLIAMLSVAITAPSVAGTFTLPTNVTFTLSDRVIPRDVAVGTVYANESDLQKLVSIDNNCQMTKVSTVFGTLVPGYTDLYESGVPGVGVQFQYTEGWRGLYTTAPRTEIVTQESNNQNFYRRVNYVVYDQVQQGTVSGIPAPSMELTWSGSCIPTSSTYVSVVNNVSTITPHTCTVTTPTVNVIMPSVNKSLLSPVGTTVPGADFAIGLDCTPGSNVYVTLSDATDPSNRTNRLTLNPSSTASGVAIQISRDSNLISFGPDSPVAGTQNQISIGPSASTSIINLSSNYVSTGTVTPGSVSAVATFTMSYQ